MIQRTNQQGRPMLNSILPQPASSASRHSDRRGLTLLEFVIILILFVTFIYLLSPFVGSREAPTRVICFNQLRQVALALNLYHEEYGSYPPAFTVDSNGKPLHSWRTLILPHMEQQALYNSIDLTKPWDDPANALAAQITIPQYRCPSAELPDNHTLTMGVIGPDAFFNSDGQSRTKADITDDHGLTITLIEVDTPNSAHWMAPQDADEQLILSLNKESKLPHPPKIFSTATVDGSVRSFPGEMSADVRKALITINADDEKVLEF